MIVGSDKYSVSGKEFMIKKFLKSISFDEEHPIEISWKHLLISILILSAFFIIIVHGLR